MSHTLIQGNALAILRTMDANSIDCCVTSPPYWGLRDYGTGQWSGGDESCSHSVGGQVQDTKAPGAITTGQRPGVDASTCLKCGAIRTDQQIGLEKTPEEFVAKLVEIFREVRRVLKPDGTLWCNLGDSYAAHPGQRKTTDKAGDKQNTSEGSVGAPSRSVATLKPKDLVGIPWRVAFALQADGWWLRQDIIWAKPNPMPESVQDRCTKAHEYVFMLTKSAKYWYDADAIKEISISAGEDRGGGIKYSMNVTVPGNSKQNLNRMGASSETRNKRSVWTMAAMPTPEAHFATFPIELPETCLLAGCPEGGIVLDIFNGAGTTGLAAIKNGRRYIGIELNQEYIDITHRRFTKYMPLLTAVSTPGDSDREAALAESAVKGGV